MKGRMQKISKDTCSQRNRAEFEGCVEGQTFMWIAESTSGRASKPTTKQCYAQ